MSARPMPHVDGVSHRDVVANGVRLHVAEAGSSDADPILMLHGWPQHWWVWRALIPPLAERHRVICPDLRGFGWSEAPRGRYEPEIFASDAIALLDALEIDRVRLAGHDWGGLAGYLLALRHPERVQRYLALNIVHPWLRIRPGLLLRNGWRLWYQAALSVPGLSPAILRRRADSMNRRIAASSVDRSCWQGGWEAHADDMRVEFVPGCGHFIADERPELVLDRALELFAAD